MARNALPSLHPCLCRSLPSRLCQEGEFKTNLHRLHRPPCSTTSHPPWDRPFLLVRLLWLELFSISTLLFRLARHQTASNLSELASAPTILTNGPGVTSDVHECQVSAESSSHNFMHENAPILSHAPEAPPAYSEAVAAP